MFFDQQQIQANIAAMREGMHDPSYRPVKRTTESQRRKDEAKAVKRAATLIRVQKHKEKVKAEQKQSAAVKAIQQKVKGVVQARKVKAALQDAPVKMNEGHIKISKTGGDKVLPPRVGPPDLSGKVRVQVDRNTSIYIDEGADKQGAIDRYNARREEAARKAGIRDKQCQVVGHFK
ncbi:MAG TPA: hypothetical protein VGM41_08335 [Chitinophagaceae bacterium]|jgi:hypothetical protein